MRSVSSALCFLAAIVLHSPAHGAQSKPDACEDPRTWVERVAKENPGLPIAQIETLGAEIVAKSVELYNGTPPLEKQVKADAGVMIIGHGNGQIAPGLVGLFNEGCFVGSFTVTVPDGEGA